MNAARTPALALLLALGLASSAAAQVPVAAAPTVIDGPSSDIVGLSGIAVARDGSGGLVYLKQIGGDPKVFVSRLLGGVFQAPEQLDAGLAGPSSQPVIAAANGGVLLVGFVNAGELYVVDRLNSGAPAGTPIPLAAGASNPSLAMNNFGKAYLSFTVLGIGGHDVRAAYYANGTWSLEPTALDAQAGDDAGVGSGRSDVAVSGDGVGIVGWGEAGHVFTRRIWGTVPSTVSEQADVPSLGGWSEVTADQPALGTGGDSSYVTVAFHEVFGSGPQQQPRVLMRRLRGSLFEGVTSPDGLGTPGAIGAGQPAVASTEYGRGFVLATRQGTNELDAMSLGGNGSAGSVARVDSLQNIAAPDAVPATAGLFSDLIAWQQTPGESGVADVHVRYAVGGSSLGPETVLSTPALGATDADLGLAAAGDVSGNAVVCWIQGLGSATRLVAAQLYVPPGSVAQPTPFRYATTPQPLLAWSAAPDHWGPVTYTVTVDGVNLPPTTATAVRPPAPLPDGPHKWTVTASNPAGQESATRSATVWVDVVAPVARLSLGGRLRVGSELHAYVSYTDSPPPEPRSAASGVSDVLINWGDGSSFHVAHGKFHAYKRPGRYTITVRVTDFAGNATTLSQTIRIKAKPKPKPKPKKHKKGKSTTKPKKATDQASGASAGKRRPTRRAAPGL